MQRVDRLLAQLAAEFDGVYVYVYVYAYVYVYVYVLVYARLRVRPRLRYRLLTLYGRTDGPAVTAVASGGCAVTRRQGATERAGGGKGDRRIHDDNTQRRQTHT